MLFAKLDDSPMLRTQVSLLRLRDLGCSTGGSLGGALGWNVVARGGSAPIPWGRVTGLPLSQAWGSFASMLCNGFSIRSRCICSSSEESQKTFVLITLLRMGGGMALLLIFVLFYRKGFLRLILAQCLEFMVDLALLFSFYFF